MKVLVTGADGQLGRSLRPLLKSAIFTDVAQLDITDRDAVRALVVREGIDTIVNCAGYTDVEKAEEEPDRAELLNASAVENLAVVMKEAGGLLVHISTDYVFGAESFTSPITEEQKPAPQSVYGLSKLHGEQAILRVGCRHLIIRTAWLYSPYGKNFVKTMLRLSAEKPSLRVVNDQRGTPTYAPDLARVIVRFLGAETAPASGIYNYTNGGECTWYDFARAIAGYAGHLGCDIRPCLSSEYPSRVTRPAYSVLDKSKIRRGLGIRIPHWPRSLKRCLALLKGQ